MMLGKNEGRPPDFILKRTEGIWINVHSFSGSSRRTESIPLRMRSSLYRPSSVYNPQRIFGKFQRKHCTCANAMSSSELKNPHSENICLHNLQAS